MSLVNYYSSSDDENSSGDNETEEKTGSDAAPSASKAPTATATASASASARQPDAAADVVERTTSRSKSSLISSLPAPKLLQNLNEPEELDTKPPPNIRASGKPLTNTSRGSLNLPAPKKRSSQPIKINAPSLPETNSDDEDEEPLAKKSKPPKGLAGLFALLPKPRNASFKETNRVLLPHTLTKKPASTEAVRKPPTKPTVSSQPASVKARLTDLTCGSDDEDEDDTATKEAPSFFSFGETSKADSSATSVSVLPKQLDLTSSALGPAMPHKRTDQVTAQEMTRENMTSLGSSPHMEGTSDPLNLALPDPQGAPLTFKQSQPPPSSQDAPLSFSKPATSYTQYGYHTTQYPQPQMCTTVTAPYGYEYSEYNQPYQEQVEDPPVVSLSEEQGASGGESAGPSDLATDKEFQRLMGKRNIGREAINIVEITADEQIGPTTHMDLLKKNLTEEKEYRVKLTKDQLPSGQQRRKHQITYLAHQAKERELELKNQWADNRQTRKQTQMKYGF